MFDGFQKERSTNISIGREFRILEKVRPLVKHANCWRSSDYRSGIRPKKPGPETFDADKNVISKDCPRKRPTFRDLPVRLSCFGRPGRKLRSYRSIFGLHDDGTTEGLCHVKPIRRTVGIVADFGQALLLCRISVIGANCLGLRKVKIFVNK